MLEMWRRAWAQGNQVWGTFSPGQRRLVGVTGALILVALALWGRLAARGPAYETLFRDLAPSDAAAILDQLRERRVRYRVEEGGAAILVPAEQAAELRLALAGAGLPRGTVGWEIFDRPALGLTDFERRVNYVRAVSGEIERTLAAINGVKAAKVNVALPDESVFVTRRRPPSAAVLLQLEPGASLSAEQVQGIAVLVARSVEGLSPDQVTVLGPSGLILSPAESSSAAGSASTNLGVQAAVQQRLEQSLQSLLEQVLGPGNVVVRAQAELNFDQQEIEREIFTPAGGGDGLLASIQELRETFQGTGTPPEGVPGPDGSLPVYQGSTSTAESSFERSQVTRNYDNNRTVERTVIAPGTVKRLSVGVIVNRPSGLSPTEEQAIRQTVAAAVGFDASRSDLISVQALPFNADLAQQFGESFAAEERARRQLLNVVLGVSAVALVSLWILAGRIRRAVVERRLAVEMAAAMPPPAPPEELPKTGEDLIRQRIERLARESPQDVAALIKTWLAEDR